MRWLFLMVVGLAAATGRAQDNAQKLFDALEQKLRQAKALKFSVESKSKTRSGPLDMKGSILVDDGNRMRLTVTGDTGEGVSSKMTWVSDGKSLALKTERAGETKGVTVATPKGLRSILIGCLTRASLVSGTNSLLLPKPLDPAELKPGKFKTIAQEKGEVVITFESLTPTGAVMNCKLWLDEKTGLPRKRTMEFTQDGKVRMTIDESYRDWELNPTVPKDAFELKKE